ncbi:MAG TPA: hypothetical protein VEV41_00925 [Terriglobales bacterium]|nr:hypothetical protein [Terriglobales bacterium]
MDRTAISDQIDRILRSQIFASKSQLRKLLEILSKNMDSQTTLKPDWVIKELWPEEIRTKGSADVATEMNRLRHALESYYMHEGKADPVIIVLPNRAVPAPDGTHEKRWIVASPRDGTALQISRIRLSGSQRKPGRGLKIIAAMAALGAVLGIVAYVSIRVLATPEQPKVGRLDGSKLVIMNAQGKELWSRNFPQAFGPEKDTFYKKEAGPRIWFEDLEGKGHVSVLFAYSAAPNQQPSSSTLICYSDRGKEEWHWTPGRELPELPGSLAAFKTTALGVLKATDKRPPRIVVASVHDPWWSGPSQIAILDSNGKTISEYWHSGSLAYITLADLDGDGREEIIATGAANGYEYEATLVVLDPDRVLGASTEVQPEFQIHSMGVAHERLRLLFPRSDLNRASFQFNAAIEPTVQDGNLRLRVLECPAPKGCPIRYEFDKNFYLLAAYPESDEFKGVHDRFYHNGKDAHTLSAEEQATFLRVRCLVGCKSHFLPIALNYSPASSFEKGWTTRSNPNGVWSYGYSSGFTTPITLYDKTVQIGVNGPNAQHWLSSSVDAGTSPAAEYNDGPAYNDGNVSFLANEFVLVAGIGGQYSDLIFTAPLGGEYSIAGSFRGAQYGVGTVVAIVAKGKVVFSSSVTSVGQFVPFSLTLNLQAGETVVFSVGPGSGVQNTGLSVTITKPCAPTDTPAFTQTGEITCSSSTAHMTGSITAAKMPHTLS